MSAATHQHQLSENEQTDTTESNQLNFTSTICIETKKNTF